MDRDIDEILKSQHVMLNKNLDLEKAYPVVLAEAFKKQLEKAENWMERNPNMEVIHINYKDVINNPDIVSEQIATFLDEELNLDAMIQAVDKSLYRNKLSEK